MSQIAAYYTAKHARDIPSLQLMKTSKKYNHYRKTSKQFDNQRNKINGSVKIR